ncbi:hypothetical protein N9N08_00180 [bacterium]|jgi:hypothetical protein|nr:hypothetical protein [bacterium]
MNDVDLKELQRSALWLIIDPWATSPNPEDNRREPNLDILNEIVLTKIIDYLPKLNHVAVSCGPTIHPLVKHIINLDYGSSDQSGPRQDKFQALIEYTEKNDIKDIVYVGFHHGMCIINRPIGAKNLSLCTDLRLYIKRDLVGVLPWSVPSDMDRDSSLYAKLI